MLGPLSMTEMGMWGDFTPISGVTWGALLITDRCPPCTSTHQLIILLPESVPKISPTPNGKKVKNQLPRQNTKRVTCAQLIYSETPRKKKLWENGSVAG